MLRWLAALALFASPGAALAAPFTLVLLGDSITAGQVSAPAGPSYAELLVDSLGPDFEVTNIGCGGASSLDWRPSPGGVLCGPGFALPNLYEGRALPALPADLVTVLLGTNDALGFQETQPVPIATYRAAIAELVAQLLLDGASQVMLLTPPPNFRSLFPHSRVIGYRAEILALCGVPGDAILCGPDVFALLGPEDFGNSIHPNGPGNAKIAAALHDAVTGVVPEPGSAPLALVGLTWLAGARRAARAARAG